MKKFFTLMAVAIFSATSFAQVRSDIQTATLIHGDQTTVFYGADAFKSAYSSAANEGDTIILSSGSFNNADVITKSITIFGAGYETDPISGSAPTTIERIDISDIENYDEEGNKYYTYPVVRIEGIRFSKEDNSIYSYPFVVKTSRGDGILKNLVVRKCRFLCNIAINPPSENCMFSQCVLGHFGTLGSYFSEGLSGLHSQLNVENCWISRSCGARIRSTISYDHCIIQSHYSGYAHYTNCIIYDRLSDNCTANYNIFSGSMDSTVTGEGNWTNVSDTGLWEVDGETGKEYGATKTFALKFPKKYIGTDGTQVGINGGKAPFDRISPIPRILESNIDINATEDGKLNVSLKVEAQTKE